jgi:hypothetical protein
MVYDPPEKFPAAAVVRDIPAAIVLLENMNHQPYPLARHVFSIIKSIIPEICAPRLGLDCHSSQEHYPNPGQAFPHISSYCKNRATPLLKLFFLQVIKITIFGF